MSDDEVVASYVPPRYLFLSIIFPWALLLISKKRREKMETYEHNREEKCIRTKNTERKKRVRASKDACKKYRSLLRKLLPKNLANTPICSHSSINSFVRSFIYLSIHSLISFYSSVCMYVHLYESICICLWSIQLFIYRCVDSLSYFHQIIYSNIPLVLHPFIFPSFH